LLKAGTVEQVYESCGVRFSTVSAPLLGNRAFFLPLPEGEGDDHSARRQSTLIQLCSPPARPQRTATTSRLARQSRTARRRAGTQLAAPTKHSGRYRLTPARRARAARGIPRPGRAGASPAGAGARQIPRSPLGSRLSQSPPWHRLAVA